MTAASPFARGTAPANDVLVEGFHAPPDAARPLVWWHWINGNVTREGVRQDLAWMKRVGIGGLQNFDAALEWGPAFNTPQQVEKPVIYLTPEWREALRESVCLADELGLEFAVASSAGWSASGGPWVEPRQAMKKLVWSETEVHGGVRCEQCLPQPPGTTGPFQNIPLMKLGEIDEAQKSVFYADVATIAYRAPASEGAPVSLDPTVTSSAGTIDPARLFDGDPVQPVKLPFADSSPAWIQFSFAQAHRIQAFTVVIRPPLSWIPFPEAGPRGWLEASDDGRTFRKIADLPQSGAPQQTVSFAPVVAPIFRLVLEGREPTVRERAGLVVPSTDYEIARLVLHTGAHVNRFEDKAGFSSRQILGEDDTPSVAEHDAIPRNDVIDLTGRMRADGSLDWTPPTGRWIVLRFGCSLTGSINISASRAGRGLEVDKLNRGHVKTYIERYLGEFEQTLGADMIGRRGLQYVVTDSYEAGPQNWTEDMLAQFERRRGYDAVRWLPVLAGRVVESAQASDRFLWDFRKTIGDLVAEAHYGQISASLGERGMGRYGESHETGRAFVGDGMEVKKSAHVPMGAMWAATPRALEVYDADLRESASVSHIYGKRYVGAEAFTAFGNTYAFAPQTLKPFADRALAMGVNRFVIHGAAHQPDDRPGPGAGLGPFGIWFTRKETWAWHANAWLQYLARSCHLLQQGRFVADVAYLYGEDTNITSLFHTSAPSVPEGYDFDFINADALLNEVSVRNGVLVTSGGMEYKVLALDASTQRISVPLLRKIRDLVRIGVAVAGARPVATPSLGDDESEFRALIAELWGDRPGEHGVGSGRVFTDCQLGEALTAMHLSPDVLFTKPAGVKMRFLHRALGDGELYFISYAGAGRQSIEVSFRITGRTPELWRADTGTIALLSYRVEKGRTIVPLMLDSNDAVFVVFRARTGVRNVIVPNPVFETLTTLEGPWDVSFPPGLGAPAGLRFEELISWTESVDPGVKYFSGAASYRKTVSIAREWLREDSRVLMDLGRVEVLAEVIVNGHSLGVVWKAPFRLDITEALHPADNRLEIKVVNLWPNRLIGDKQPGARKIAFAAFDPFKGDSPLLPSGLLGPVALLATTATDS